MNPLGWFYETKDTWGKVKNGEISLKKFTIIILENTSAYFTIGMLMPNIFAPIDFIPVYIFLFLFGVPFEAYLIWYFPYRSLSWDEMKKDSFRKTVTSLYDYATFPLFLLALGYMVGYLWI